MRKKPISKKKVNYNAEDSLANLAARIQALRISKGYSAYETFAYENNLSRAQYGRYERGVTDMRFTSLLNVLNALDITLEEFFKEGFNEG